MRLKRKYNLIEIESYKNLDPIEHVRAVILENKWASEEDLEKIESKTGDFANNDIEFTDATGIHHDKFSFGLKKSEGCKLHSPII